MGQGSVQGIRRARETERQGTVSKDAVRVVLGMELRLHEVKRRQEN